VMFS